MKNNLSIELRGLARILLVSIVLCLVSAIIVYYSGLRETLLAPLGKLILIISIFFGGCYVSKTYGSKGLVRGMSTGTMFFLLILIATLVFNPAVVSLKTFFYTLIICIVSGGLGGILGIGLSDTN
jgi:putative membrane protein (TIGR04086 family)